MYIMQKILVLSANHSIPLLTFLSHRSASKDQDKMTNNKNDKNLAPFECVIRHISWSVSIKEYSWILLYYFKS